ncbi:hypothetical protein [Hoeflea sp. TYP-13]|uniref:hypothetical protein n=1 Tax=Hoeflea sp. TYP-13 TaxID=3230023 RepID=UPI0034C69CEF
MDPVVNSLFDNAATVLGFGFLGLSMIFVVLGYMNVKQIVNQPNPNERAVGLSRFFLKIALVFMLCAGPLQWITLAIEKYTSVSEVQLHITMTHPEWEKAYGDIYLVHKGETHPLVNKPYRGVYGQDDEIQLNAEKVAGVIRKIQAQLTVVASESRRTAGGPGIFADGDTTEQPAPPPPVDDIRILSGG